MHRIILLFFSLIVNAAIAADISSLSSALISTQKPVPAKVTTTKLKIQETKVTEITPALILELPSNKFLGKVLNSTEKSELKNTILEIAHQGLLENDMTYKQNLTESNKSPSVISILGSVLTVGAGYNRISHGHRDLQQEKYLQEKQYLLRRLTESYIDLFEAQQNFKDSIKAYKLTNELTALVGANTIIKINKLLQRID